MVGDKLVCVWQALFARVIAKGEEISFAKDLRELTEELLNTLSEVPFSKDAFDAIVKHGYVSFQDYKKYIMDQLSEDEVPDYIQVDQIEEACWKFSKDGYKSNLSEKVIKKLWQISNRLTLANSYPPMICKEEINLVCEKVTEYISDQAKDLKVSYADVTFPEFLKLLEEEMFKGCPGKRIEECVNDLHCWLVWEVCKTGWMQKRAKTGPNWTNWVKRWVVLVPNRLMFYEKENPSLNDTPKSEFVITDTTKVVLQDSYKGAEKKLTGRFKISNPPISDCELATNKDDETKQWMTEICEQTRSSETPVQKLLRERYIIREELKRKTKDNTNALNKYLGVSKCARGLEPNEDDNDEIEAEEAKLKALYMKLDVDGNGYIDRKEFDKYIKDLGLKMKENEVNLVFHQIDKNSNGVIDFDEFCEYFSGQVLDEQGSGEDINAIRGAFLAADRDGTGKINFKEFSEYMWGKKTDIRMSNLLKAFSKMEGSGDEELSFSEFKNLLEKEGSGIGQIPTKKLEKDKSSISAFERHLQNTYKDTESDDLADFLNERWKSFAAFRRQGSSGGLVMTGGDEMVSDVLPGNYNLVDLVCFSDLPPLKPKHTIIKGVKWVSSKVPGKSGRATFPSSFDGKIATEFATNEHLRYYGASFAENQQLQVSLCYRHGIQDFTYENNYLEDYAKVRGCGIETHSFAHLDCPLDSDNGVFVLGKLEEGELHLTAFRVPARHTVYVPAGTIHSNDYLIGTWRTMLSDEAVIDHVFTVREKKDGENITYENFQLTFD